LKEISEAYTDKSQQTFRKCLSTPMLCLVCQKQAGADGEESDSEMELCNLEASASKEDQQVLSSIMVEAVFFM
jgi:hypothetical protein